MAIVNVMADKITFIIILHNHQPVGNFDWVFKNAAEDAYMPFLDVLERHPSIRIGLHTTGPLLEWYEANNPEYLSRLADMVEQGRIEILGGAFYEPILSILPARDQTGQINMMNNWIEKRFGKRPYGFWVAERIWEPGFASVYGSCELTYTTLDNTHFLYAGVPEDLIWGSYNTEDQGISIRVLPIDFWLRYLIPFHEPQESIDYIGSLKDRGVAAVTYADDGEKFGVWPGTKKWVYEEEWLEKFFMELEENANWINIMLPGEYVKKEPPLGLVYLPTASYKEMTEWALPVEAQKRLAAAEKAIEGDEKFDALKPFIRGGFWRNFITKYPETNAMCRRMLMVSNAVEAANKHDIYKEAVRELYMAQCNCGYWHGVFGGLYLNFLRRAIYEHLIKAERLIADKQEQVILTDFDGDGHDEAILRNDSLVLIVSPHQGGAGLELDYYPQAFNIFDTMTRREEAYHELIPEDENNSGNGLASIHEAVRSKENNIRSHIHYDWYRRLNFIDHFMQRDESLEAFADARYTELGDFVEAPYHAIIEEKSCPSLLLEHNGSFLKGKRHVPVTIHKRISLPEKETSLAVSYRLVFDEKPPDVLFGVEFNLGLQSGHADDSIFRIPGRELEDAHLASKGVEPNVSEVELTVGWMPLRIRLYISKPAILWRFPVETISQSEGGIERNYQNTCIVPVWHITGEEACFNVNLTMEVKS